MTKSPKRRQSRSKKLPNRNSLYRRLFFYFKHLCFLFLVITAAYAVWLDQQTAHAFERLRWALPARVYAQPLELYKSQKLSLSQVREALNELGYRRVDHVKAAGQYAIGSKRIIVHTRGFMFWDGEEVPLQIEIEFDQHYIAALHRVQGHKRIAIVRLEPMEIERIHPARFEDRILIDGDQVTNEFKRMLVGIEDRRFYEHHGIDIFGIVRAVWRNLSAGHIVQGASTISQQLVKNMFLSRERSYWRKFNEALMALSIEFRYSKSEILKTYINEVYLGQDGNRAIHGFGLAADFYYGRPLAELSVDELALLVGMVKGPSLYNPERKADKALARRNVVLKQLAAYKLLNSKRLQILLSRPLRLNQNKQKRQRHFPAYMALLKAQLLRDYDEADLHVEGLRVFSTLRLPVQSAAEVAVIKQLGLIEKNYKMTAGRLQSAVIITEPATADILAVVGGRRVQYAGFNRATQAARPIGSLIKPFIYMTALSDPRHYHLRSPLRDKLVSWTSPSGSVWRPKNYDGQVHGVVALEDALARSFNLATVNLGFELGVPKVNAMLRRLGFSGSLPQYPSLFLGAVDMTPLEVTRLYQVLAADGFRSPLNTIKAVTDAEGRPLKRYPLEVTPLLDPVTAFLGKQLMQTAVRSGTGKMLNHALPDSQPLAGKTGTSDDGRDSWFAGFGGDYLGVVWVGRDDNKPTKLTGASGALKIWAAMMAELNVAPLISNQPADITWAWVSPDGSSQVDEKCAGAVYSPFHYAYLPPAAPSCEFANTSEVKQGNLLDAIKRWFD